jgi:integrase
MRTFSIMWNFAAERATDRGIDPLPLNPVKRLKRKWFDEKPREGIVADADLPRFYQAILALKNPVHSVYLQLLLFTGLRRTEAATLTWADIDFEKKMIVIPGARTKTGRALDLPMSDYVFDLLSKWGAFPREKFVFFAHSKTGHIVEPKHPLDLIAAATGITVTVHDLRRTFVTIAEASNISPVASRALVNHSIGGKGDIHGNYNQMKAEALRIPAQRVTDRIKEMVGIGEPLLRLVRTTQAA